MSTARIGPLLRSPLLSLAAKARMGWEYFVPARKDEADESLEHFVVRRFGREAFDRLVQPLIGGIYTADPAKLSMLATLPNFVQMERQHGGLLRGMRKQRPARPANAGKEIAESGARYGMFVAPKNGMESFVQAIAAKLRPEVIQRDSPVEAVARNGAGTWQLTVRSPDGSFDQQAFDAVIVAAPAYACRPLLEGVDCGVSLACRQYRARRLFRRRHLLPPRAAFASTRRLWDRHAARRRTKDHRHKNSLDAVFGGWFSLNGNGEMTGTTWLEESGLLDGPVLITNTHSVGVVRDAVIAWRVKHAPPDEEAIRGPCQWWPKLPMTILNDMNGFHVKPRTCFHALDTAQGGPVEEGSVGGGTGMICNEFKGGIGTSSRVLDVKFGGYTVGVLVQCNYGRRSQLRIAGSAGRQRDKRAHGSR